MVKNFKRFFFCRSLLMQHKLCSMILTWATYSSLFSNAVVTNKLFATFAFYARNVMFKVFAMHLQDKEVNCHWLKVLSSAQVTYQWLEPNLTNRVTLFFKDPKHSKHLHQLKNNLLGHRIILFYDGCQWPAVTNSFIYGQISLKSLPAIWIHRTAITGPEKKINLTSFFIL